jgi:hypothetical protein
MPNPMIAQESRLVAELNDLLQLDHDAVQAYTLAISLLQGEVYKETLRRFRGDHERHIIDLTELIRTHGGVPIQLPHLPSGVFKLAVQAAAAAGGDAEVLLAFRANERQVRDKYRRHAQRATLADVAEVLRRNASDEEAHFTWVVDTLSGIGYPTDSTTAKVAAAVETGHQKVADAMEGAERRVMAVAERGRRTLREEIREHPLRTALVAVGAGVVLAALGRRR